MRILSGWILLAVEKVLVRLTRGVYYRALDLVSEERLTGLVISFATSTGFCCTDCLKCSGDCLLDICLAFVALSLFSLVDMLVVCTIRIQDSLLREFQNSSRWGRVEIAAQVCYHYNAISNEF